MEVSPTPVDPDMFSFNEESMEITIYSGQLYSNGDYLTGLYSPGSYTVQVKAFTDDLTYTGESIVAQVDIHDPCAVSSKSVHGLFCIFVFFILLHTSKGDDSSLALSLLDQMTPTISIIFPIQEGILCSYRFSPKMKLSNMMSAAPIKAIQKGL